jgi:rhodanese-related sulfurtransferase
MKKNLAIFYKTLVFAVTLSFFLIVSPICGSYNLAYQIGEINILPLEGADCPINITVHEAWELLNDTSNGIQIPIDVRTEDEWNESFIDTSWPEHPRFLGNMTYWEFNETYGGEEVIIYCKGGYRSLLFCYQLCYETDFNGTVYNMEGGITTWIEEGYPVRNNTPPEAPQIKKGNPRVKPLKDPTKSFIFTTIDPDNDKIFLYIDWGDGTFEGWIGPYNSSEEVKISHTYTEQGTFTVKAKAKDIFKEEGPWGILEIPIDQNRPFYASFFSLFFYKFPFLGVFLRIISI